MTLIGHKAESTERGLRSGTSGLRDSHTIIAPSLLCVWHRRRQAFPWWGQMSALSSCLHSHHSESGRKGKAALSSQSEETRTLRPYSPWPWLGCTFIGEPPIPTRRIFSSLFQPRVSHMPSFTSQHTMRVGEGYSSERNEDAVSWSP